MTRKNFNPHELKSKKHASINLSKIIDGLKEKERGAIARALSLLESTSNKHEKDRDELLNWIYKQSFKSRRIGITGSPGVGKSSFIEQLGLSLCNRGEQVAVLSIDPSSTVSKGSILGDKTRMTALSQQAAAFIRPSPSSNILGGVAGATRESIALFDALGYENILVETVGVGQSETAVSKMTDLFILLLLPGAGDGVQGIKRGIVEMSDLIFVNKADQGREKMAQETMVAYRNALNLFPEKTNHWKTKITTISSLEAIGFDKALAWIDDYFQSIEHSGFRANLRNSQAIEWFKEALHQELYLRLSKSEKYKIGYHNMLNRVKKGDQAPYLAAKELLNHLGF
jgi:LAO/AO transport system kinase